MNRPGKKYGFKFVIFLSLLFCLINFKPVHGNVNCDYCYKAINGKYMVFNVDGRKKIICQKCNRTLHKCDLCKLPVKDYKNLDNKRLCRKCYKIYSEIPLCSYCNKRMINRGTSIKSRNIFICEHCFKRRSKCRICKIPLGLKGDNNQYCSICQNHIDNAKTCYHCGKKLLETYTEYTIKNEKRYLCLNCKDSYSPCYLCGFPSHNMRTVEGKNVCRKCLYKLDRCRSCNEYCMTRYNFTLSEYNYCSECIENSVSCSCCGAPVNEDTEPLSDGRFICEDCEIESVNNINDVKIMLNKIKKLVENSLDMKVREIKHVRFADKNRMLKLSKNLKGVTDNRMESYPSGLFERKGEIYNIYVLPYLRKDVLRGVIAHEFGHAFLAEYYPGNKNLEEVEGFCEWLRYRVLLKYKDKKGVKTMMERKDFYGRAFKKIYSIDKEEGYEAVFEFISRFD